MYYYSNVFEMFLMLTKAALHWSKIEYITIYFKRYVIPLHQLGFSVT